MGAFSNRVSFVNGFLAPPPVTVISAVGIIRRNIWSEAQVLQCPQRASVQCAAQGPLSQPPVPSPGGQPLHPQSCSDESYEQWSQAAPACSDQRNGCPERQTLCKITESFLGHRHPCFAITRPPGDGVPPILQTRGSLEPRQDHDSSLVQQSTSECVAAPRYPAAAIDFARLILSRREPEVRAYRS
jgi:hypothetical protein